MFIKYVVNISYESQSKVLEVSAVQQFHHISNVRRLHNVRQLSL